MKTEFTVLALVCLMVSCGSDRVDVSRLDQLDRLLFAKAAAREVDSPAAVM